MDPVLLFSTAFIIGLSGALMPGPVTAVTAEHTIKRGVIAAPLVTLGHGVIEIMVVALLVFGLGRFMAEPGVAGVIGIIGGAVLIWLGWGMISSARSGALSLDQVGNGGKSTVGPFSAGILTTLANPYWFLWWATVGAGYVALSQQHGLLGVLLFFSGHILADLSWLLVIAVLLVTGKKFISDRIYSGVVTVLGAFLMVMAAYFFWMGVAWVARLAV